MNIASFILIYYSKYTNLNKAKNKNFLITYEKIKKNFRILVESC